MSTLQARLSDPEYRNWVKSGICLLYIKEGLEDFVANTSLELHQNVLDNLTKSAIANTGQPVCGGNIYRQRLVNVCQHPYCQGFLNAVVQEGLDPNHPFTLKHGNLANSDVSLWHSHPYELAKMFMNPGQKPTQSGPAETDLSGIVNFIAHCKVPCSKMSNIRLIEEVRKARNAIMHSSEFKVTEPEFKSYSQSMINLLNDVNISASPRAKHAAAQLQRVTNAADFTITLEDEGKVMNKLTDELHTLAVEIKQNLADIEKGVKKESSELKMDIQHGKEEMRKVNSLYNTLQQRVDNSCDLRDKMRTQLKKLETILKETIREHTQRLVHIEQQQEQTNNIVDNLQVQQQKYQKRTKRLTAQFEQQQNQTRQKIGNLQAQQKTCQTQTRQLIALFEQEKNQIRHTMVNLQTHHKTYAQLHMQTHKEISDMKAQQKTYQIETNESIENVKTEQILYQRKTDKAIDDLRNKAGQTWIPTEEDKSGLVQYLIDGYKPKIDVTLLPDWEQLSVSDIFSPVILVGDQNLESYKDIFYDGNELVRRVILLGEAGAGKTTFSKHLTDVWCKTNLTEVMSNLTDAKCEPATLPQFADVAVFKQFKYLFYVSCRFAEEKETVFHMINNQLFDDEKMTEIAIFVLKNYPERCLIVLDGVDEWKGSPSSETGGRGDIVGLPGMAGVEGCVILVTSRPWRFHALTTKAQAIFRCLKFEGLKNVENLVERILRKMEDPDPVQSSYDFLDQVWENDMYEVIENPLILIIALGVWVDDKSFHKSICSIYNNMIQSFVRRSKGQGGWLGSESKLRQLIPNLEKLETKWGQKSNELPHSISRYKSFKSYAGLFISLGQLAFDLLLGKEEQSLVFSKAVLKSYLCDNEIDESVNACLALGILSKTETTTRGLKKLESFSFCHKTFQEFFAALWLASRFATEKSKLYNCIKNNGDLISYGILITFLCGFDPEAGKRLWIDVTKKVEFVKMEKKENKEFDMKREMENVNNLVCKCMKEQGAYLQDQMLDQIYFCIPHILIDCNTSDQDLMLLCHVIEEYACNVKSLNVYRCPSEQQALNIFRCVSSCLRLQRLKVSYLLSRGSDKTIIPVLDLQRHNKLEKLNLEYLSVEGLLLPVEGAGITSLCLRHLTMNHYNLEKLPGFLSSCSELEHLNLRNVKCNRHSDSSHIPVLDLQKQNKLEKLKLEFLSDVGLLLPMEGARITSLCLDYVTMTHNSLKNLPGSLSSCPGLEHLSLSHVKCSRHSKNSCISVLDTQKHKMLEKLKLMWLSLEGLLLPVEGDSNKSLIIVIRVISVTMPHHGCEQLIKTLSSCVGLEQLYLDSVACSEHGDTSCILPVLDVQKHNKLENMGLSYLCGVGFLLPTEGTRLTKLDLSCVQMPHNCCKQLSGLVSSCSSIECLVFKSVMCSKHRSSSCISVLDLQIHTNLVTLDLELDVKVLLPVEGARITALHLKNTKMTQHESEQTTGAWSSYTGLEKLELNTVTCNEHGIRCCLHILDLQKHNKLEKMKLYNLSVESILLPVEGARITSLHLEYINMNHHDLEVLSGCLSSCYGLEYLCLNNVRCREHSKISCFHYVDLEYLDLAQIICKKHSDSVCLPVLDLHKHNNLKKLVLCYLTVDSLQPPNEEAMITSLCMYNVTMTHLGLKHFLGSISSCSCLENLGLAAVRCSKHKDSCCVSVLDLQKFNELEKLVVCYLPVESLLLPVNGDRITHLDLYNVTLTHHDLEQLSGVLSSCYGSENLSLREVKCSEHGKSSCKTVLHLKQACNTDILNLMEKGYFKTWR